LASAADEAALGATVGAALGASETLGVAVVAAVGAGAGYLMPQAAKKDQEDDDADSHDRKADDLVDQASVVVDVDTKELQVYYDHVDSVSPEESEISKI